MLCLSNNYKYLFVQESFATENKKEVKKLATKEEIVEKLKAAATAEELEQVKAAIDELKASLQAPAEQAATQ